MCTPPLTAPTEVHIQKYTKQRLLMVKETPELVFNILSHKVESEKILFEDPSPETGFILIPDMKWDLKTVSSLYLVAITHSHSISTLRDLKIEHIPMLKSIRRETGRIVRSKWGLEGEMALRFYVHYQPSYYHFHVHVVNANYSGFKGVSAGQAHLLEDIISLLELSSPIGPTLISQMSLTYQLGEHHGLFKLLVKAQDKIDEETRKGILYV
ncbi:hypothetical protein Clacol_004769 [Clathrus columnatus]|uniref:Scavenger mRNA decapping enzyme n=1 Tax=Clathrus columnatus TaxID=1419009 RepID=A0AAV5AAD7_9AGAM|nr:hypothetical protein Clacol_004769 [Clathrus columnatus]